MRYAEVRELTLTDGLTSGYRGWGTYFSNLSKYLEGYMNISLFEIRLFSRGIGRLTVKTPCEPIPQHLPAR
jgi:hypothetical protein